MPRTGLLLAGLAGALGFARPALADDATSPPTTPPVTTAEAPALSPPLPVTGFRVEGDSKLTAPTLERLTRLHRGQRLTEADLPDIVAALTSTQLFKTVAVRLEAQPPAQGEGVIVVATLQDKLSWVIGPTLFVLSSDWAVGLGYVENNLFGADKKILLYGQVGKTNTFFYGTYLDPAFHASKMSLRVDVYTQRKVTNEYPNPRDDATSTAIGRTSTFTFRNAGLAVGWRHRWWLTTEYRVRGATVGYADPHTVAGATSAPATAPSPDGRDVTVQARVTADRRGHDGAGVTWGPYAQLNLETYVPGASTYQFADVVARAYYSWRLRGSHQLELRVNGAAVVHAPYNEEFTLGAASDLRGYATDQFRGDTRLFGRAEYSVPIGRLGMFKLRALAFFDAGYLGFHLTDDNRDRAYLPGQVGHGVVRSDVGGGLRVYVDSVVLPLLGVDVGYGIEGQAPAIYFELGLTDF